MPGKGYVMPVKPIAGLMPHAETRPLHRPRRLRQAATLAAAATLTAGLAAGCASAAPARPARPGTAGNAGRATAAVAVKPVIDCGQLAGIDFSDVPDAPAVVLSAARAAGPGPAICQVIGYIAPQEQFILGLPESGYSGRYLQQGCGGLCGLDYIDPIDATAGAVAASCPAISAQAAAGDGIATGTDNQGHVGGETDRVWATDDPALRVSFGYASEHAFAQVAKAIIAAYYGKPPARSYYEGRSGGGHEALVEAQRYPHDFNGILAGAPGNIEAQLLGVVPAWLVAVNTSASGREILTSEKLPALHDAVLKACANRQGLITDPRSCDFNPASIECPAGVDKPSCLTPAQVKVAREYYLGPNDGRGHYLYPGGEPYGSELAWETTVINPATDTRWPQDTFAYQIGTTYLKNMAYWNNPPASFRLSGFRFTVADYDKLLPLAGIYDATDPDLSAFRRAGGKLIMYQGWADQRIPPFGTMGEMLNSLMKWVEQGTSPGTLSFPLVRPATTLSAITAHPLNPLSPPPGGARGLNIRDHWIGQFRPGDELWCGIRGMDLACSHQRPPISYTGGSYRMRSISAASDHAVRSP